jgi:hypothetical protein
MQIASIFHPGHMVGLAPQSAAAYADTPTPETPTPNPYNDHADGWFTRGVTAGVLSQEPIKLILESGGPGSSNIGDILKQPHVQAFGKTVGLSAAVFTGLSLFRQGAALASGKQTAGGAGANIISDAMRGVGAGAGAYAGSSITAVAMKAFGATGGFGAIVSMVGGIYGAGVGAELVEATGVRSKLLSAFGAAA